MYPRRRQCHVFLLMIAVCLSDLPFSYRFGAAEGVNDDYEVEDGDNDEGERSHLDENVDFDGLSIMPVSCINYNNGHVIKFELFDNDSGYQCRFRSMGSYVVSIAHYMRAYFNYQALVDGRNFEIPNDARYLTCESIESTDLYAKVGCMDRETFTSTRLQLHVYTDSQCSVPYDDGESSKHHSSRGYQINGYYFSTEVSFRPQFYSCHTCTPQEISDTFNKKNGNWYDDDYMSNGGDQEYGDDLFADDNFDDEYGDDGGDRRALLSTLFSTIAPPLAFGVDAEGEKSKSPGLRRSLYDNYYDIGDWNMCQRVYQYGVWCDEECQALDTFRVDEWSKPDIFLLVVMCAFITAMMGLVLAKRLKTIQKARFHYGNNDNRKPGLPPMAMVFIFAIILVVIVVLARLKFVNETLVFAVVTCILLFIYMLKLTLFENRKPVLLAAPQHDLFDNPIDRREMN